MKHFVHLGTSGNSTSEVEKNNLKRTMSHQEFDDRVTPCSVS